MFLRTAGSQDSDDGWLMDEGQSRDSHRESGVLGVKTIG